MVYLKQVFDRNENVIVAGLCRMLSHQLQTGNNLQSLHSLSGLRIFMKGDHSITSIEIG